MNQNTKPMTAHMLNRTLKRMFRFSSVGLGVFDTAEKNGQVEFYWQINDTQSFYVTVKADVELVEATEIGCFDTNFITINEVVKTEFSMDGRRYETTVKDLIIKDFIDTLRSGLDKTYALNHNPFDGGATIYKIR